NSSYPRMGMSDTETDDSKLVTTDTVYVSPDGGATDEAFPKPNVEYHFCVDVANAGELSSGPFFARFNLSGEQGHLSISIFRRTPGRTPEPPSNRSFTLGPFPINLRRTISKLAFTPVQRRRSGSILLASSRSPS